MNSLELSNNIAEQKSGYVVNVNLPSFHKPNGKTAEELEVERLQKNKITQMYIAIGVLVAIIAGIFMVKKK